MRRSNTRTHMMDTRTGEIVVLSKAQRDKLTYLDRRYLMEVSDRHVSDEHRRKLTLHRRTKIGRNEPCPCGSGKKFKRCHYGKEV